MRFIDLSGVRPTYLVENEKLRRKIKRLECERKKLKKELIKIKLKRKDLK